MIKNEMNIETKRHSLAHIMALAVQKLFPGTKFGIGPSIENGFYYDFDLQGNISPTDLPKIEKKMRELLKKSLKFEKKIISKSEAKKLFKNQPYKLELIKELVEDGPRQIRPQQVSIYSSGDFIDLCSGPHIDNTQELAIDTFKLTKIAGAYWRGNEKNKMLTRIYGIAFETKEELKEYEKMMEEAKKRDHRKLGKELGLYTIRPEVGAGLILWKPKGAIIINELKNWFEKEQLKKGYLPVITPHIGKKDLWITSGHWNFYNDSMYPPLELGQTLEDYQDNRKAKENEIYLLKPMNCPFHIMIYNDDLHSYKDLPLKYYEFGTVYRYEQTGELGGLTRVRGFTQDDAHIICSKEQLKEEMKKVIDFAFYVLRDTFGFELEIKASFRDKENNKKQMGSDADWDLAEKTILGVLKDKDIEYELDIGEAAFYGPKIDIKVKDAIGRSWQLSTVQFDFNLSEKFDMKFKNRDGIDEKPFVIHRALLGSLERFMGVLIEHYAGAFPFWLAPVQIKILPVVNNNEKLLEYAKMVLEELKNAGIRTILDTSDNTFGKKIRNVKKEKIPYFIIIGEKDMQNGQITLESRNGQSKQLTVKETIQKLEEERKF